jgi:hypothetical protein
MLRANSLQIARGWGVAKRRANIGEHRISAARLTSRPTLQQLPNTFSIGFHRGSLLALFS